jgi:nucleoside-diphosphate-sugar epimerase
MATAYHQEYQYHAKIARLFHTFGPGINMSDGRVFSDFIKDAITGDQIHITGDKRIKRAFLYLSDAVIMLLNILFSGIDGEIYNVGNDNNIASIYDFATIVANEAGDLFNKDITVKYAKSNSKYFQKAVQIIIPDISKFKKHFSYTPAVTLKQACKRTLLYYKECNAVTE